MILMLRFISYTDFKLIIYFSMIYALVKTSICETRYQYRHHTTTPKKEAGGLGLVGSYGPAN